MVDPVPGTKILLRRSDTQGKKPGSGDAEYGELFINYHSNTPMLCFKDNADTIVEIRPLTALELELGELTDVDTTGAINGMVLSYNGSTWVPVTAASLSVDVDLGYTAAADKGTVTNSAGDDAEIPLASNALAGLMAPGDKDKLDNYPADPTANLVDLNYTAATDGGTVTNTGGTDASLPLASDALAGLMAPADKEKLDAYPADPTNGLVDLGYTAAADKGTVTNTGGADAEIPLATDVLAGLTVDAPSDGSQYARKDGAWDVVESPDLQSVTDEGNTTTNDIITTGDVNADNVVATGDVQATSFNGGQLAGFRNQLINGDFRIWQRGTSFATSATPQYTLDRWYSIANNGTVTRNNTEGPEGQAFSLQIAPDGNHQRIYQAIELARPGYAGPFIVGSTWTLSFYAKVFSGSMQVTPRIDFADNIVGTNDTNIQTGSNVTITDSWQRFSSTFTIAAAPNGTNNCLRVVLNEVAKGSSSLFYSMIQLEPGPVATPFEHRPIGTELALCQRYFYLVPEAIAIGGYGDQTSTNKTVKYAYPFPVVMRATPTKDRNPAISGTNVSGTASFIVRNASHADVMIRPDTTGTFSGGTTETVSLDAEL